MHTAKKIQINLNVFISEIDQTSEMCTYTIDKAIWIRGECWWSEAWLNGWNAGNGVWWCRRIAICIARFGMGGCLLDNGNGAGGLSGGGGGGDFFSDRHNFATRQCTILSLQLSRTIRFINQFYLFQCGRFGCFCTNQFWARIICRPQNASNPNGGRRCGWLAGAGTRCYQWSAWQIIFPMCIDAWFHIFQIDCRCGTILRKIFDRTHWYGSGGSGFLVI